MITSESKCPLDEPRVGLVSSLWPDCRCVAADNKRPFIAARMLAEHTLPTCHISFHN